MRVNLVTGRGRVPCRTLEDNERRLIEVVLGPALLEVEASTMYPKLAVSAEVGEVASNLLMEKSAILGTGIAKVL